QKTGGNVASYFCEPDGRVIQALSGPAPAKELLEEARWAVALAHDAGGFSAAHRAAMESLEQRGQKAAPYQIHRLLAGMQSPVLEDVYRTVFETIGGQRLSRPATELDHAEIAFAAAKRFRLPVLLILHIGGDNQAVLRQWQRTVTAGSSAM